MKPKPLTYRIHEGCCGIATAPLCCIGSRATAGAGVLDAPLSDCYPLGFKCCIVISAPFVEASQN